jgi:uncharacterized membrane protein YhhN
MRFVFLALMCIFAGIHAARGSVSAANRNSPADVWDIGGRLFFSIAASLMYVLAAVGSRTGVRHEAYYVLVLTGLSLSLVSDILFTLSGIPLKGRIAIEEHEISDDVITGRNFSTAGYLFSAAAGALYIAAFYSYAAFSWYDAAFFALISAFVCALLYNVKKGLFKETPLFLFIVLLCAMCAKALSLLLVPSKRYLYTVLAAAGAVMLICSNIMRPDKPAIKGKAYNVLHVLIYYCGQGLIALSVMI